jgi:hypothetical protein
MWYYVVAGFAAVNIIVEQGGEGRGGAMCFRLLRFSKWWGKKKKGKSINTFSNTFIKEVTMFFF